MDQQSSMPDLFDDPKQLIDEAKGHMPLIKEMVDDFIGDKNWTGSVDKDPDTGEYLLKINFKEPISKSIKIRIFDVAGYLRSALDQACYASAVAIKGGEPSKTKFLFADKEKGLQDEISKGKCKDMHPDIIDFIIRLKPYETGNKPLWALNKIRNKNVHRLLEPTAVLSGGLGLNNGFFSGSMQAWNEWKPLKMELTFFKLSANTKMKAQINPIIHVAFNSAFGFPSEPVSHSLDKLISEVESIVVGIEAETARIVQSAA
ncbi:hypothetical protein [Sinorhizobium meliloti]|uniref:hypothetical protein n=1 Tax=Rhizobium meliloti TaxID=382 RepID=UPI000FD81E1B|nr:hypothetical protein [Sinorhizobium meliloti]RVN58506.1 hypothetical protein CN108_05580 [Sinorhizobium meliloti]